MLWSYSQTRSIKQAIYVRSFQPETHNQISSISQLKSDNKYNTREICVKRWQETLYPADKRSYNKAATDLKKLLSTLGIESLAEYFKNLDPHSCNHKHNLWRVTKYLKRPAKRNTVVRNCNGEWCRSDDKQAKAFAQHLHSVF